MKLNKIASWELKGIKKLNFLFLKQKKVLMLLFLIIFTFSTVFYLGFGRVAQAAPTTYYARADGNWNVNTTWSLSSGGGAVGVGIWPIAGDTVYIGEGGTARTVTIPAGVTAECATLYLGQTPDTNKKAGTLTFAASNSILNVSGNAIIYGPLGGAARTINVNAGAMTVGGNFELGTGQTGNQANRISKVVITTGTVTVSGGLTFNNIAGSSALQTQIDMSGGAGTFNLAGAFTINNSSGTLAPGTTSTFNFNGTSAQTIPIGVSSVVYNNLNINNTNASGATLSAAISATNVTGNISVGNVSSGSLFNTGNFAVVRGVSKTLTVASGSTMNAGTSVVTYGATGTATINGTFKTANTVGFSGSATTAINSTNTPTITLGGSSTIEYNSGSAQAVTVRSDYANLTFSGAGAKTTAAGTITVSGNWDTSGGLATLNTNNTNMTVTGNLTGAGSITSGSGTISLAGNCSNSGTFTPNTGTFTYSKTTGGQTVCGYTYYNLNLNNSSGIDTAGGSIVVNTGTMTTTSGGTLDMGTVNILSGTGTFTNNGTIKTSVPTATSATPIPTGKTWGGTIQYGAFAGAQTVVTGTYNNLTLSNTSATDPAGGNLTVNGTLITTAGGTLDMATYTLGGTLGTITNNGTIKTSNTSASPIPSGKNWGGTFEYASSGGAQTMVAGTYNNLIQSGSSGSTLGGSVDVGGTLTLTSGNITTGGSYVYIGSTGSVSGGSTSSHVNGNLRKQIGLATTSKTFEIGDGTNYTPVDITNATVGTAGDLTVKTTTGQHPNLGSSTISGTKNVNRYWSFTVGTLAMSNYDSTFNFVAGDVIGGANTANFIVGKYAPTTWTYPTVGNKTSTSTQATSLSSFSDFALGELGNTAPNAPSAIDQYKTDATTVIAQGGYTKETSVVFKATATDPESDTYKLEVEVVTNASAFTDSATCSSVLVASGSESSTGSCGSFSDATSYKWQYRLVDSLGAATSWTAFGGSDPDFIVDTTSPTAFTVGSVITTGGTVVAGKWNATNTGVDVTTPIANDASLTGGTLQIQAEADGSFENIGSAYTILVGDLGTSKTLSISAAVLEGITGFSEGDNITFKAIITDIADNSTTGSISATSLDVDQIAPSVTIDQAAGQADPTSDSPINFTVVFSESVSPTFATGDVSLSGTAGATTGTVTEIAPNDGTTYNVAVTGMTGAGTVIASIDTAKATDAAGNANTASTSTDNSVTYGYDISGTTDLSDGATIAVALNGVLQTGYTGTVSSGTWTIIGVPIVANDIVTVWNDGAATADETTAVTKQAGSDGDITGMVLNRHVLSLGSSTNRSLTLSDLGLYDWNDDEDIMHSANGTILNVDANGDYTDENIDILASTALTIDGTETLNTVHLTMDGTLTSGGDSTYIVAGDWIKNVTGSFAPNTSTVTLNGTDAQAIGGSSPTTFNNLIINKTSGTATLNINTPLVGDLSINSGTFDLTTSTINRASSGGTLTVSNGATLKIGGTNTMPTNYDTHTFGATSTIEYSGTAQTVSNETYAGHLTLSGSGTKTMQAGTTSIGGNLSMSGSASATTAAILAVGGDVDLAGTSSLTGGAALTITGNITIGATATFVAGAFTHNVAGDWTNNGGTFTNTGSTINLNGTGAQDIGGSASTTFNDLTISNTTTGVTTSIDTTVNGVLTLNTNPSATLGSLDTGANTLNMGASATTVGAGDVTGIVTRATLIAGTAYTFGNQYTTINFENVGTLPTDMSIKIVIGSAPAWKTDAVKRIYEEVRTGSSDSFATINFHYLDSELNGNSEDTIVKWAAVSPFTVGSGTEDGRSNYDTTDNWVGTAGFGISTIPTSFGSREVTLADTDISGVTWNGSVSTDWMVACNWTSTPGSLCGVPSDLADVTIPDASTTDNDPILKPVLAVGRLTLESGAILNTAAGYASTVTISGASGAWSNNGGTFNANVGGTAPLGSTIVFTNASASMSGETNFYNVTINSGAELMLGTDVVMGIAGTMTNNGTWDVAGGSHNTINYNGGAQTVLNPNGTTPGYHYLILSGSGTKTMPGTALNLDDDLTLDGTVTATALEALTIGGSVILGSGTTFNGGAYTHDVAGDWTNNGATVDLSGTTINLNGSAAQTIGGTSATTFDDLTINNSAGAVLDSVNPTVDGVLTLTSGKITTGANRMILGSTATLSGCGAGKYVYGNLRRYIPATLDLSEPFCIGDATNYTPVTIDFVGTPGGSGYLDASTSITAPTAGPLPGGAGLSSTKYILRRWVVSNNGVAGFTSYSPTFTFVAGDIQDSANTANLVIRKLDAGTWTATTAGTRTGTTTQCTGLTSFSEFADGEANTAPTGAFNSASQITDGSGNVAVSIEVDDADTDDTKAKIEYETDSDGACDGPWAAATLLGPATADSNDSGGAPDVNNANPYQVGTTATYRIITSSGSNTVAFDWDSATDLPTANGTQCLRLTVNDDNTDSTPATQTVAVDNVAPAVNITAPLTTVKVNGTYAITFTDDELTSAQCSIDNTNWVACTTGVTTLSAVTGFGALGEGAFTLYLKDTDAAGNIGTDSEAGIVKDSLAPTVNITAPLTTVKVNGTYAITFTDDELTSAQCSIDNTNWVACTTGVTTLSAVTGFGALGEGAFTLYLTDTDVAGNTGTDSEIGIIKDSIAPTVNITAPLTTVKVNGTYVITFTDDELTAAQCSIDNTNWVACTTGVTTLSAVTGFGALSEGAFTLYLKDTDAAGNPGTDNEAGIVKDSLGPDVTIDQAGAQADPTTASPINFTVVFSEPTADFATGDVSLSGTAGADTGTVTEIAPNDGTTYNVAVSGMTGAGTVIASIDAGKATDAVGNPNTASTSTDNQVSYAVPHDISGTTDLDDGDTIAVALNGVLQTGLTGTVSIGAWTITDVPIVAGDIVTVWNDGAATADETTAVTKQVGSGDITGMVLNRHVLSLGSSTNQSLTLSDLGLYDYDDDEDIMHSANASVLTVDANGDYTDEEIDILTGNTLTIGGTETLNTVHLTINGTLTSGGDSVYNVSGDWTNDGTFTASTSTVTLNGTGAQAINGSSAISFNNLTINKSGTATLGKNTSIVGDLSINSGTLDMATFTINRSAPGGILTIANGGTLKIGDSNTLPSNYSTHSFGSTSTVEYGGTATTVATPNSSQAYGNLVISGSAVTTTSSFTVVTSLNVSGSFIPSAGTITMASGSSISNTGTLTFKNLTIAAGGATGNNDFTVSGVLTLNANASATVGNLDMVANTLTMGASATTVGAGDVTGIVKRTTLIAGTSYTFGNQYTTINFRNIGTLPTEISFNTAIGTAPLWKADGIQRIYDIVKSGTPGSGSFATLNLHYLDSELNGNTENDLVKWFTQTPLTPGSALEYGRSNYDTTNNWVGTAAFDVSLWPTSPNNSLGTLGDSVLASSGAIWNGLISTSWSNPGNWTPNGIPSDLADVTIPDATTTPNDPTLNPDLAVGRMTIESGGILNTSSDYDSIVTISGASGAWSNNGGTFNANVGGIVATGSTIIFTNANATMSGITNFYNVTINSGASLQMGSGDIMRIAGTMTNTGTWRAAQLGGATVEYNGASQTVINPNGLTPGYDNLILSGSGTKTLPAANLDLHGDFINNGVAVTVTGNTITLTGSTGAQTIGGTSATTFNNLTLNNSAGAVLDSVNPTVDGVLTFTLGNITTGVNDIYISSTGSVLHTSGHVVGNLRKYMATGATSKTFEIGDASEYTPVDIAFDNVTGAGDLTISTTSGDCVNIGTSTIDAGKTANRCWTMTNSGITFTDYDAVFNFVAGDLDGGAVPGNFVVGKYDGGWTYPTPVTPNALNTQVAGLTSFSDWQLGEAYPAPTITTVTTAHIDGSFKAGEIIDITVTYDENVTVDIGSGTPTLALNSGGSATYNDGSGTDTLTFSYTVGGGDASADLDYSTTGDLALNGGTIKNSLDIDANNTLPAVGTFAGAHDIVIDNASPTVSNVTSSLGDGIYSVGQLVPVDVVFDEVVYVTGTPQITLVTTDPATTTVIDYSSGDGTDTLTFDYTVILGDNTVDLDYEATTSLALNSGTIQDAAANDAVLTLVAPGAVGSLGNNKAIVIDTDFPYVTNVTSSTSDGYYKFGDLISIQIVFSESVTVAGGTPTLTMETGGSDAVVNYASGSNSDTLTFDYTVGAGENSADLDYNSINALALAGATIKDTATGLKNVTLSLPTPGAAGSLGNNKNIVVDTADPTISATAPATNDYINSVTTSSAVNYTLDEDLLSGTITMTGTSGPDNGNVHTCTLTGTALDSGVHTALDMSDTVNGCTSAQLLVDGSVYIFDFDATDLAGNNASTVTNTGITFDTAKPDVTIDQEGSQFDPTNVSPILFTAVFSEPINTGTFTGSDVAITGTATIGLITITEVAPNDGTTFEVSVVVTDDGTVIADIPAGNVADLAGNTNNDSTSTDNSVTADALPPTIGSITSVAGDITVPYYDTIIELGGNTTLVVFTSSGDTANCNWDTVDAAYGAMSYSCASATTCTFDLAGETAKTVYLRCKDNADNEATSSYVLNYTIDATAPVGLTALTAGTTTATTQVLDWTAVTETNFGHYEIWYGTNQTDVQNRAGSATKWANITNIATTTATITGLTADTTYYYKIWAIDLAEWEETVPDINAKTLVAPTPPRGGMVDVFPTNYSISINNGATCNISNNVTLNLGCDDASEVMISNAPTFSGASWQPFTFSTLNWTLNPGDGTKTVYVQYRSNVGRVSPVINASIEVKSGGCEVVPPVEPPVEPPVITPGDLTIPINPLVILYEFADYHGRSETFTADNPDLRNSTLSQDNTYSIRVVGGAIATLFHDINYTGSSESFSSDDNNLIDNAIGIKTASSIKITAGEPVAIRPGNLIKNSEDTVYYYGGDGKRHTFPNENTYFSWYNNFDSVIFMTDAQLSLMPLGKNVTSKPGVRLIKITTDPKVYAIDSHGTLRWITGEDVAKALYGANWSTLIDDLSDAFFVDYQQGDPINNATDFDPAQVTALATSINVDLNLPIVALSAALVTTSQAPAPITPPTGDSAAACHKTLTFSSFLNVGSTGPEVTALQILLQCLNNFSAEVDFSSYFGPVTEDAVKKFQAAKGLESVGSVGPATRAALNTY